MNETMQIELSEWTRMCGCVAFSYRTNPNRVVISELYLISN